ncbi:MAG: AAA family ATPase [Gemmatimonadota bacterium]|nr:AAA family ATPase [Gemmatimonadota bacterium]
MRLFALGDARIETSRAVIEPTAEVTFAAALYLILERKDPVSRRGLERLLWPGVAPSVASHRLRQTLLKLKRLGVPVEAAGKATLRIDPACVDTDFERLLDNPTTPAPITKALGVLPGYEPTFSPLFADWLDSRSARINSSLSRLLLSVIARNRVAGDWSEVESNATNLLRVSPYNEEATLALAESYALRGAKIDAVQILDKYLDEIGSGPTSLRLPASLMRKRIGEKMAPRDHDPFFEVPFVGRGELMKELTTLLGDIVREEGRACILWGEAGIGKTKLLSEFMRFASLQGVTAQRVLCRASDPHRPLSVFLELVPALRVMPGAIGCSPESLEILDGLTRHRPLEDAVADGGPEVNNHRVQTAIFDLIDAVVYETPLMIVVEDLQWLDTASAAVFGDLILWLADRPLLFAFSLRNVSDLPTAMTSKSVHQFFVPPLADADSTQVILGVVRQHAGAIGADYLAWCLRVADGNPYFLHELANHWLDTGEEHSPPPSLATLLDQRIQRLTSDSLQLLQAASVLESHSTLERIEGLLGFKPYQLLQSANELGRAGMVVMESLRSTPGEADCIAPKHDLLSNAALSMLTPPARGFLHRRAATVLQKEIGISSATSILWECAKHWHLAGDINRAHGLATSCATRLMEAGLASAAAEAYERALSYCTTDDQRRDVLENQANAFYRSSSWKDVTRVVSAVRQLQQRDEPAAYLHDDLELMELRAEWQLVKLDQTRAKAIRCLGTEHASLRHRVEAGCMALMLLDSECDHESMRAVHEEIETLALEGEVSVAALLQASMVYHTVCGDLSVGVSSARELVAFETKRGNRGELFRAYCNASATLRGAGHFEEAESLLINALDLAQRHQAHLSKQRALPMLANMALERGRVSEASHWLALLVEGGSRCDDESLRQDISVIQVRLALLSGDYGRAVECLPMSIEMVARDPLYYRKTYHAALHVAAHLGATLEVASEDLELLIESHLRSRRNMRQGFSAYLVAVACEAAGECARGERLLDEYLSVHRREPWPSDPDLVDGVRQILRAVPLPVN